MATQLIPIVSGQINGQTALVVNARDLHAGLEVGKDFSNWIKDRIQQYGFIENQDFRVFANFGENPQGGRPAKEYGLSLDMAKELAMVERTEKGRLVRRYFIDCERLARGQQADLTRLQSQLAACHAELLKVHPLWRKVTRYRRMGLNHTEVGLLVDRSRTCASRQAHRLEACGILTPPESAQLSLLEG